MAHARYGNISTSVQNRTSPSCSSTLISYNTWKFRQFVYISGRYMIINICMENGFLGEQNGEGMMRYWPQRTRFYFWGFLRLCQFWWKSIKKCDRDSAHRRIHRYTDRCKPIYNLCHATCYIYGTDNNWLV